MCRGFELRPQTPIYRQLIKEILFLTFLIFFFYIICIIINIVNNHELNHIIIQIFCAYHLPNIMINVNLGLYWLTLRVISLMISYSNSILNDFKMCLTPFNSSNLNISHLSSSLWYEREFYAFNLKKSLKYYDIFITLTEISANLDQLMREIINIFRFVLILMFVHSFMILTIQFFSVYKYFDSPDVRIILSFLLKFVRLMLYTVNIIIILWSNNCVINEKCRTIYILNSLPIETLDMERNISSYLFQLMVRKHTVSVFDIFELDLTFLLSVSMVMFILNYNFIYLILSFSLQS
ncbi:putative gustatory receptor 59f [Lucilia cuprina]|nr:putative gustatory receptor 59f [Lucilia cuprina]